ncbi:hypothetical protein [Compostibacter hankyongensis]|uniref:Cbb3-type cytochrome c oxidase subunit 3 n=1 Tax=Compostibacter hankyongensis TaxID=1007089 RepID=A0ABP8FD10_9BACT
MKRLFFLLCLLLTASAAMTCPVCDTRQPAALRGITHGTGPESRWDYLIVWAMVAIVLATLFFSVKWMIRPDEGGEDHIKNFILNNP